MERKLLKLARNTKYPVDAYIFVQNGLDFTVTKMHGKAQAKTAPGTRHITGEQLCFGLRDFAIHQYGLLARTVLRRWSINSCEDFGHIVFKLVEAGLMAKTDEDTIEDFIGVFNFNDAFGRRLALNENS